MLKPDIIYDANTRNVAPISDWSKSIKSEKCSEIARTANWLCENPATHWAVMRDGIFAGCANHLQMGRGLIIDEVHATIDADGIHFGKEEDRHMPSLVLGTILYYTCTRCGIEKLSVDINHNYGNAGENVCNDCSAAAEVMAGLPVEVLRHCMRCHEKFTKENDKHRGCPFCLTCHLTGAVTH